MVNDKMMDIFVKSIVASLPDKKRVVYQFIESIEESLAQQSETKEQFLTFLKEHSPHLQAANRFSMTIEETVNLMHQIEDEINLKLEEKLRRYQWIDCTDKLNKNDNRDIKHYVIIS
ncbi:hypothetical protein [Bacillus sp. PS06]|uniref:hypothetical protein n=1 Tax=Bacillus sp. PS06 TaxID=2764176 RepID=UPI001783166B|nr:hypothetical protein [Bacillus sp. PS06]MBD8068776.1 hypothetical protein [Bacillus sp. PS06]